MPIHFLRYANIRVVPATYEVRDATEMKSQAWHETSFMQMAEQGFHLIYDGPTINLDPSKIEYPFYDLSDSLYGLDIEGFISTNNGCNLMIMPLPDYYLRGTSVPCPIPCIYQTDWFPGPLRIMFSKPKDCVLFEKDKPFLKLICLDRSISNSVELTEEEIKSIIVKREFVDVNNVATRKWINDRGIVQSNTYNVLVELCERGKLPEELSKATKKIPIIRGKNG